jgi:signal peptidase I
MLKGQKQKSAFREWVESIVIAFIMAMFIREFFVQAFKIPSGSMIPTLLVGDRLMVNKLRYGPKVRFTDQRLPGFTKPKRGDIIVFIYPEDPKRDFIKRLIAFSGEAVEIKDGDIYVDGKRIEEPAIDKTFYYNRGKYGFEGQSIKVPPGHVFVLGDNSASSHDSRFWGFVPEENIIGRAELIYWPFNRMRFLE